MNLVPLLLQLSEAVEWQDMWRKQLGVPRPVPTFRTLSHFVTVVCQTAVLND